jgi:hypothetical protein
VPLPDPGRKEKAPFWVVLLFRRSRGPKGSTWEQAI